jgi:hypothetical protein
MEALAVVAMLVSLFSMVFWMVMGARAVRAHETIASGVALIAKTMREPPGAGAAA